MKRGGSLRRRWHGDRSGLCPFVAERRRNRAVRWDLQRLLDVGNDAVCVGRAAGARHDDSGKIGLVTVRVFDLVVVIVIEKDRVLDAPRIVVLAVGSGEPVFLAFGDFRLEKDDAPRILTVAGSQCGDEVIRGFSIFCSTARESPVLKLKGFDRGSQLVDVIAGLGLFSGAHGALHCGEGQPGQDGDDGDDDEKLDEREGCVFSTRAEV